MNDPGAKCLQDDRRTLRRIRGLTLFFMAGLVASCPVEIGMRVRQRRNRCPTAPESHATAAGCSPASPRVKAPAEIAGKLKLTRLAVRRRTDQLRTAFKLFFGDGVIAEVCPSPHWYNDLRAMKEHLACRCERNWQTH